MLIKRDVKQFIKSDCEIAIGSEGLIGDKLVVITQGNSSSPLAKEGQHLFSSEPVETDAIMASLQVTAQNAEVISQEFAEIMVKVNSGEGTLGKLIQDSTIAENLNQTMANLKRSSKGLDENMEAAKHNILLKGYFNKKKRASEKKKEDAEKNKREEQKRKESK
jgi:phospholipid/cholesterol/gamma-HCH transport system substrate-binding protein